MIAKLASRRWSAPAVSVVVGIVLIVSGGVAWVGTMGVVLVLCSVAWFAWDAWQATRRDDEAREFATTHGWEHQARSYEYNSRFQAFPFSEGSARRQESVLRGSYDGQRCATFAHVFENRRDSESQPITHAFQVTLAELPVALPRLDIVPQDVVQSTLKVLGGRDVEVESHEFNRRWRVRANDARYAHAVLDPRMVERLTWTDVEGASIRIEGAAVYVWGAGRRGTDDLARRLGIVAAIARRIPATSSVSIESWAMAPLTRTPRSPAPTGPPREACSTPGATRASATRTGTRRAGDPCDGSRRRAPWAASIGSDPREG